jgi:hypothetical protein
MPSYGNGNTRIYYEDTGADLRVFAQDVLRQCRLRRHRDAGLRAQLPRAILILPDDIPAHPYAVAMASAPPGAERPSEPLTSERS